MKRYLFSILLVLFLATPCFSASYYGCGAGAINGDATWCAVGDVTNGVCAKDSGDYVAGATALAGTHTLYANGCTITVPSGTFTAAKLSTKGDGSKGVGGGFTVLVNGVTATIDASIEGGTTDCLTIGSTTNVITANILTTAGGGTITTDATATKYGILISGSAATVTIGKSGSPVTVTGGSANNAAISDVHTVTTTTVYANMTGGTATGAAAYKTSSSSGALAFTGNITAGSGNGSAGLSQTGNATITVTGNCVAGTTTSTMVMAYGCQNSSAAGTMTVTGDCQGSTGQSAGCFGDTAPITFTGNMVSTATAMGAAGRIIWSPSAATKYIKVIGDGTPAQYYLTSNVAGGAHPPIANVQTGVTYGWDGAAVYTGTLAGGGAWAY